MAIEYVRKHKDIPTWQRPEFSHKKDESGVAFAEEAVFVALDGGGGGGAEEAFGGPQAVVAVHFHATETAAELAGHLRDAPVVVGVFERATTAAVPLPMKGSKMRSPGRDEARISLA